jgi:hypothetical protein
MTKRYIDATQDNECQELLADLASLLGRARGLSERFDREYLAVGKCWGITRALQVALDTAESEFTRGEE